MMSSIVILPTSNKELNRKSIYKPLSSFVGCPSAEGVDNADIVSTTICSIQNDDVYTYEYGVGNRLERIKRKKKYETESSLFVAYEYDLNGNTTRRTIYKDEGTEVITFTCDTMNRLIQTTDDADVTDYYYDNAGNRFIKTGTEGTTVYLRHGQIAVAMDVEVNSDQSVDKGKKNRYVLSGDLVAGRITTIVHEDESTTVTKSYYHLDHLNSTKCVTDENGVIEVSYTYRAFGEQLKRLDASGLDTDDKAKYSYGGKELDGATNLYYFNARYYDATIGRFINVDPIQDGSNWYVYAGNNPLSLVDPTGLGKNDVEIAYLDAGMTASIYDEDEGIYNDFNDEGIDEGSILSRNSKIKLEGDNVEL